METEPRSVGVPDRRFLEGDIPTGVNMTQEEINMMLKRRQVVDVVIRVDAACGTNELGGYERRITISLKDQDEAASEKVLEDMLEGVKLQAVKLIRHWKKSVM